MPSIKTSIDIASPPSRVRDIFLDFPNLSSWHRGDLQRIEPYTNSSTHELGKGNELQAGDRLFAVIGEPAKENHLTLLENSEHEFRWRFRWMGIPGLLTAEHFFRFENEENGGTRFVQGEDFCGLLGFVMMEGSWLREKLRGGFVVFNEDLKARCEKS